MNISKTIKAIIDQKNISQFQLADISGVSQPQISNIMCGRSHPRKSTLDKLAKALEVDVTMLIGEEVNFKKTNLNFNRIPLLADGSFLADQDGNIMEFVIPIFEGADFLVINPGEAMVPRIRPGDLVAGMWLDKNEPVQWGHIYMVVTKSGRMIKRINKGSDTEHYSMESINTMFESFEIKCSDVVRLARVLGIVSLE